MTEILGRDQESLAMRVTTARTVVIPREARAGVASLLMKNDTHERETHSTEGMIVWMR